MKYQIIVLLVLNISIRSLAQDIETATILWEADRASNKQTNESHALLCSFKSTPAYVEWIQKNGELKTTYQIISSEGTWNDVNQAGSITFIVERNGNRIKITFTRANGQVTVALDFSKPGQAYAVQEFNISNVQTIN